MPRPCPRLGSALEQLEDRALPAPLFGIPWPDPGHMTLSFVPDGTLTPTGPSNLFATMASAGPPSVWEGEMLRAFQAWAVNANINISLVADGGEPLGTVGAVQGDPRFGDIRIAASNIVSDEAAEASPFSWSGTTYAGDVTFDSAVPFTIGNTPNAYDIFSVAIHEAGHVFSLDHSTAPGSVMNEEYSYHTGLAASDIANLQALYGTRTPDAFEGKKGDDTIATAAKLQQTPGVPGQFQANADLTTMSDVDVYSFNAQSSTAAIRLQAQGLSLLEARVTVYDSAGNVLMTGAASSVFNNDVTLQLSGLKNGSTYYVQIQRATADVFGIGAYQLTVNTKPISAPPPPSSTQPAANPHPNNTLQTALALINPQTSSTAQFDVAYQSSIQSATETDFYQIKTSKTFRNATINLNVLVWATDGNLDPAIHVFDAKKNPVAFEVLANQQGLMSIVIPNAASNSMYYIEVSSRSGYGGYFLAADFNNLPLPPVQEIDNGQLSSSVTTTTNAITVEGGLYQFNLYAQTLTAGAGAVTLTITNSNGNVLLVLTAVAGDPALTQSVYLMAGTYTLTYTYSTVSGQPAASIRYHLGLWELSDGVGTYAPMIAPTTTTTTTTAAAPMTSPTSSTTTSSAPPATPTTTTTMMAAPMTTTTSSTTLTAPPPTLWLGTWYFF